MQIELIVSGNLPPGFDSSTWHSAYEGCKTWLIRMQMSSVVKYIITINIMKEEVEGEVSAKKSTEWNTRCQSRCSGKTSFRKLSAAEIACLGTFNCQDTAGPSNIYAAESVCLPEDSNQMDVELENELLHSSVFNNSTLIDIPIDYELPRDKNTKLTDVSPVENLSIIGDTNSPNSELFGLHRLSDIRDQPWCLPNALPCIYCGAVRFHREPPGFCCSNGQVPLCSLRKILKHLIPAKLNLERLN